MIQGKKHICFNVISDPNWHAGNIYIFNCIYALNTLPTEEREQLFISISVKDIKEIPADIIPLVDRIYIESLLNLFFFKFLKLAPSFLRNPIFNFRKIDFYYPGSNLPKKWIFNWGGWIPDFQYKYLAHLFSPNEIMDRENRNRHLAISAPILAFSSENAIKDYFKFFPQYKGNEFLLRFVNKTNEEWLKQNPVEVQKKLNLPDAYFIVCNQFWKHKDHGSIIRAMGILKNRNIHIDVVCTGSTKDFRNPDYFPSLIELAKSIGVESQFHVAGFISREDQIQLIRRSIAIIQPSLFEGWSTVVEDGRSLGKTIFLSNIDVHIEQAPPHAHYFKEQDAEELANLIEINFKDLKPGPDLTKEKIALQDNQQLMRAFGRNIVKMASSI